jgi:hypothetical protein
MNIVDENFLEHNCPCCGASVWLFARLARTLGEKECRMRK